MTQKEMALKIATLVLEFQMREIAFTSELELYRVNGQPIDWQEKVNRATSELVKDHPFRDRVAELSELFDQSSPDSLLETLYMGIFRKSMRPN